MIPDALIDLDINLWLAEDIPLWDVSAQIIPDNNITAKIIAKQDGVICGINIIIRIFDKFRVELNTKITDGNLIKRGDTICTLEGSAKGILQAERTALNILSHLSGIASSTRYYSEIVRKLNPKIRVSGTRKTLPGLRKYEKWAIQCGGGDTHRTSLSDMVMLKENHIAAIGNIKEAVKLVREKISFSTKVEIEVRNLKEAEEASNCEVDIIMLDNFSVTQVPKASQIIRSNNPNILIEISGNVTEKTIAKYGALDIDIISSGKLTHSVTAFDVSLLLDSVQN